MKYIREHKDEPFFLYHPTQLPHGPVAIPELHPDYADREGWSLAGKNYASMVRMLDDHVGLIMAELNKLGIDDNTIVFFTSDNGHELYYGPKPRYNMQRLPSGEKANLDDKKWRTLEHGDIFNGAGGRAGLKRSGYQGGMQAPLIVRWPNHIKAGTTSHLLSAQYDFMATLADLVGEVLPEGKDSRSYLPTLLGSKQTDTHEYIIVNNHFEKMGRAALITRDGWKLVQIDHNNKLFQLYNLNNDNEERHNLAEKYPERVSTLKLTLLSELESSRHDL